MFGGEVSGHYYFHDFYNADSGTIPALLILELLSREGQTMSRAARALPLQVLHLGRDQLRGGRPGGEDGRAGGQYADARVSQLDGVSVDYDDWHFNVRPSNTEPLLRLNLESLVSRRTWSAGATRCWRSSARERRCGRAGPRRGAGHPPPGDPTPFAVGRVNTYLIEDDPLTLVDSGPNSAKALDELEQALAALGHRIEDLDLLVVTHQHIDHLGLLDVLAAALGRRGGCAGPARALRRALRGGRRARRRVRRCADAPSRAAGGRGGGPALGVARLPGLGVERAGDRAAWATARSCACAIAGSRCSTAPVTPPPTPSSGTPTGASSSRPTT